MRNRSTKLVVLWAAHFFFGATVVAQEPPDLTFASLLNPTPSNQSWIKQNPDQFSWMIFALISKKAVDSCQIQIQSGIRSNNTVWESWASDDDTFPTNPSTKPVWNDCTQPGGHGVVKRLHKDPLAMLTTTLGPPAIGAHAMMTPSAVPIPPNGNDEEVRRNVYAFNFITSNDLWYREGILKYAHNQPNMAFPAQSIEVKAIWEPWYGSNLPPSHFNYDASGIKFRLVALHIATKVLDEWTWATFEWVDNIGRCDVNGCNDNFGVQPHVVQARVPPNGSPYHAGNLTGGVKQILKKAGLNPNEWSGYRLKGSQTLTSAGPAPKLLANSAIEGSFAGSSSCLACHQRARVATGTGVADPNEGKIPPTRQYGETDFLSSVALAADNKKEGLYSTDFVWAFLKACPLTPDPTAPCIR